MSCPGELAGQSSVGSGDKPRQIPRYRRLHQLNRAMLAPGMPVYSLFSRHVREPLLGSCVSPSMVGPGQLEGAAEGDPAPLMSKTF